MEIRNIYKVLAVIILTSFLAGCGEQKKRSKDAKKIETPPAQARLDKTIGDLAEVVAFSPIPVKGVGLVVGLPNTGSSECPSQTRDYLRQYIIAQLGPQNVNAERMINSLDTAVVLVEGFIPPAASKYQSFDVTVTALPNTQTTSLNGGRLYTTELKLIARIDESIETSKILALAAGPVYIDNLAETKPDPRSGFVLGGGKSIQNYQITLALLKPDFQTAANIRNRINQRFGRDVASAVSAEIIYLSVPDKFKNRKTRFVELVKSLYVTTAAASENEHINSLIERLRTSTEKEKYETALEAIGKNAAAGLLPLIESADNQTKFSAARCLLAIGNDQGLKILREYAQDNSSAFQIPAIQAIGDYAGKSDIIALMSRIIRENKFDARYNAYKYLQKYNDTSIIRTVVAEDFYIDQVITTGPKTIYASKTAQAGIVLFGAPIKCQKDIYVESDNGQIIVNSLPNEDRVSIMRKHPITKELMGPFECSAMVADVIKTLGEDTSSDKKGRKLIGLGAPYSDIAALLKKMVDKGAVDADFVAGPSLFTTQP
ncbi:MAG: flagellar basal body P-ring protein FlgI [Planctomycetes bacterium]|nr:flagellar basal body P-ring protein FlgI [Planctomycetota bacterium]